MKRLLPAALAFVLLFLPLAVRAADYTDIWYLPAESGWGVNMVQSDNFIFATFFIYGPGNTPTWYTAQMSAQANGNFAGSLYATVGTYFGAPWDHAKVVTTLVGTASFAPANLYQGTLTYGLTGGATVTKTIERQALTAIPLANHYLGGRVGAYSGGGCAMPGGYQDTFNLQVLQPGNGTASFQFSYAEGLSCTLSGALAQVGRLYSIPSATYQCSNGVNTTARMDGIQATARGIQGAYAAPAAAGGCAENATFTAVVGGSTAAAPNVAPLYVDAGPASVPNILFVTVTVCVPGSSTNCQTIDHVQVDTGSSGLRLMSSVLSPALSLPQQVDGSGNPIVECVQFVDGFSWGAVRTADLHIAGEQATSLAVQIIGDPAFPTIPTSCSSSGPPENDVATFGANGLVGIGLFLHDCGNGCAQGAPPGFYYSCPASGCVPTSVPVAQQLANPVSRFSVDNNGSLIALNPISASGAATASGSLIFGIGTQSNNGMGKATAIATDPITGYIITHFNNQNYTTSYVDSGSTLLFISTGLYPLCTTMYAPGFYCPPGTLQLSATLEGNNQAMASFSITNADQLFTANPNFYAVNNVASPAGDVTVFDWGLPFFYGRSVFTAIETMNTPAGMGPFIAF